MREISGIIMMETPRIKGGCTVFDASGDLECDTLAVARGHTGEDVLATHDAINDGFLVGFELVLAKEALQRMQNLVVPRKHLISPIVHVSKLVGFVFLVGNFEYYFLGGLFLRRLLLRRLVK